MFARIWAKQRKSLVSASGGFIENATVFQEELMPLLGGVCWSTAAAENEFPCCECELLNSTHVCVTVLVVCVRCKGEIRLKWRPIQMCGFPLQLTSVAV